jgi:hypothetical protein
MFEICKAVRKYREIRDRVNRGEAMSLIDYSNFYYAKYELLVSRYDDAKEGSKKRERLSRQIDTLHRLDIGFFEDSW